jgi:hypothetical protein
MKYEMTVQVYFRPIDAQYGPLDLQETTRVEFTNLSEVAAILAKLHELFEELGKHGAQ